MAPKFLDSDLPALFSDWGDSMTFNSPSGIVETGNVIFDHPDKSLKLGTGGGIGMIANEPSILFITAQFPDIVQGSAVTVNGTPYVIRNVMKLTDGRTSQATLRI